MQVQKFNQATMPKTNNYVTNEQKQNSLNNDVAFGTRMLYAHSPRQIIRDPAALATIPLKEFIERNIAAFGDNAQRILEKLAKFEGDKHSDRTILIIQRSKPFSNACINGIEQVDQLEVLTTAEFARSGKYISSYNGSMGFVNNRIKLAEKQEAVAYAEHITKMFDNYLTPEAVEKQYPNVKSSKLKKLMQKLGKIFIDW